MGSSSRRDVAGIDMLCHCILDCGAYNRGMNTNFCTTISFYKLKILNLLY